MDVFALLESEIDAATVHKQFADQVLPQAEFLRHGRLVESVLDRLTTEPTDLILSRGFSRLLKALPERCPLT